MSTIHSPATTAGALESALGVKRQNFNPVQRASGVAAASGTIYALMIATVAGETYTGVKLSVYTAGSGTAPTGFFVGLATQANIAATGAMLAQSDNLKDSAALTTGGFQQFAFNAPYTETASGLREIVLLENGAFGSTAVTFGRMTGFADASVGPGFFLTCGTAQTALPANGNNLPAVYAISSPFGYWAALY